MAHRGDQKAALKVGFLPTYVTGHACMNVRFGAPTGSAERPGWAPRRHQRRPSRTRDFHPSQALSNVIPTDRLGSAADHSTGTLTGASRRDEHQQTKVRPQSRFRSETNSQITEATMLARKRETTSSRKRPNPISSLRFGSLCARWAPNGATQLESGAIRTTPTIETKAAAAVPDAASRRGHILLCRQV